MIKEVENKKFYKKWDNYKDYLSSVHWADLRDRKLKEHGDYCSICKRNSIPVEVHHVNYENFPDVSLDSLQVVCHFCHKGLHGKSTYNLKKKRRKTSLSYQKKLYGNIFY